LKSKKIYLIRHGQTDYNLRGIVQGSGIDAPLNDTGSAQAAAFYKAYCQTNFDKVYTSTLQRAIQSVGGFIKDGLPHEQLAGLNEISWGDREGVEITPEADAYYHQVILKWQQGNTSLPIDGGESPDMVMMRQKEAMSHILAGPEENLLICMHGRAMRILLCLLLKYPLQFMDEFEHSNLCLYKLNYTGNTFNIDWHNDTRHLQGRETR
jgi:probable phosphoglycerate mutase